MTLNGINLKPINLEINDVELVASNTADDGTVYAKYNGEHAEISFDLEGITSETRQLLRESKKSKCLLVMDSGEEYYVRPSLSSFVEVNTWDGVTYNVSVTCREVGGVS